MRKTLLTLTLAVAFSALSASTHAQTVVWSTTNFVFDTYGAYGAINEFVGPDNLAMNILTPGEGTNDLMLEVSFDPVQSNINFQTTTLPYAAYGNTNAFLANYFLSFDMQVTGNNISPAGGVQISLFANQTGPSAFAVFGPNLLLPGTVTNVFTAGTGYQHYSFSLGSFKDNNFNVNATNFSFGFGFVSYPADVTAHEVIDFGNIQIVMTNTPPPPPRPTLTIKPAQPGLRIFGKASDAVYTQEGIGTVDNGTPNQSWLGSTAGSPATYSISFLDFDTVAGYTMNVQLAPGAGSGNPYGVYQGANDLLWTITSAGGTSGFTTAVAYKTNSPANIIGGETNVLLARMTTTSTNGLGTWTLSFTSDTHGTVTAPDGTTGSFDMAADAAALFANPLTVLFGTSAGATGGYGQYVDIGQISITNVAGINEFDDFTKDSALNTTLWDPNFSRDNPGFGADAGSVFVVSSNKPSYWVNWTLPDNGYGLETKASLSGGTNVWFSPNYYGSGTGATNSIPSLMGQSLKWTLVPAGTLPTVDGTVGGPAASSAFFRMAHPAPSL